MINSNSQSAKLNYADNYSVKISGEQLKGIAKPSFYTHINPISEKIHRASQFLLIPWKKSCQFVGSSLQSRPGANKEDTSYLRSRPVRFLMGVTGFLMMIASTALAILTSPVHIAALCVYRSRPVIGFIDNSDKTKPYVLPRLAQEQPFHVRSHNLGFVLETMSITGDLRPVCERAHEVAENVLNDPHQPDLMIFNEAFHEDGTRILCDKLKDRYHYILPGVLPSASGFNSGALVASKHPILDVQFHCLEHNIGPERLSPKGVIRVKIQTAEGPVHIYSVHTQALIGKDRAEARYKQLIQIDALMKKDFEDRIPQILMGDLNTSVITAWGESNIADKNNPEVKVQNQLEKSFVDLYLNDHHAYNGLRTSGAPQYLNSDNTRMGLAGQLPEPSGSWYVGPFAEPTTFLTSNLFKHNQKDRRKNKYCAPLAHGIEVEFPATWGTTQWRTRQAANTSRFDYILVPKHCSHLLDGRVEIRRVVVPEGAQSASTDHLPVDAAIWRRPPTFQTKQDMQEV